MKHALILTALLTFACGDDSSTTPGDDAHPLDGTCEPIAGANSYEIIDAAFTSGALDLETSLAYKAFAEFQDPRLPAECLGDDTNALESKVIDEIYDNWTSLSPNAQVLLEPFVIPPAYVGSWANAMGTSARLATGASPAPPLHGSRGLFDICNMPAFHPDWASKPASDSGLVKVWYNTTVVGEATRAQTILTAVENDVWPKLVGTLGMRAPLSDGAEAGCNGGDGRLDIYLTHIASKGSSAPAYGLNMPIDVSRKYRPAFIQINHNLDDETLKATVAHEFMHASQWAYPVAGIGLGYTYPWLKEATAQWAIDYVYPIAVKNFEQLKVWAYIAEPFKSLESGGPKNTDHMYGSYLFFQFLTKTQQPAIIKNIWDKTTMVADELGAVDGVIPGGFKEQWPKFAKALWNRDPVELSSFYTWDAMVYPIKKPGGGVQDLLFDDTDVKLGSAPNASILLDSILKHLSIRYYKYTFPTDVTTRSVAFSAPDSFISVQAFIQKAGSTFRVWEDWSGGNVVKHYCIDVTAERLTELVIVLSNDSVTEDAQLIDLQKPRLLLSSVGCWRYQGTTTVTINDTGYTETVTTNVTLDVDPGPTWVNDYFRHWKVYSGTANATSVATDTCTFTSTGAGAMTTGNAGGFVDISFGYDFGAGSFSGRQVENASGDTTISTTRTNVCPSGTTTDTGPYPWHWLEQPMQILSVNPNGTINLDVTEPYNTGTRRLQWNFAPLRQ